MGGGGGGGGGGGEEEEAMISPDIFIFHYVSCLETKNQQEGFDARGKNCGKSSRAQNRQIGI